MIPVVLFGKHTSSKGFRLNYPIQVLVLHKLMLMLLWTLEEEDVQRVFMYGYCLMKVVDRKMIENMMKSDYEYMQFFFDCLSGWHDCAHLCYCY